MSYNLVALLTNAGKEAIINGWLTGTVAHVKYFALGSAGHDPDDPKTELSPDRSLTNPQKVVLPPKEITRYYKLDNQTPVWVCTVNEGDLSAEVSSLYLIASIVTESNGNGGYGYGYNYPTPEEDSVLIGVANFALSTVLDIEEVVFHVGLAT